MSVRAATRADPPRYWGEPTETPEWRRPLTDRLDMPGDGIWPGNEDLGHY